MKFVLIFIFIFADRAQVLASPIHCHIDTSVRPSLISLLPSSKWTEYLHHYFIWLRNVNGNGLHHNVIYFVISTLFSETADRQIDYVRQLCVGNPRLQYLVGKNKNKTTYTRTLNLDGLCRSFSDSDVRFFRDNMRKILIDEVSKNCAKFR